MTREETVAEILRPLIAKQKAREELEVLMAKLEKELRPPPPPVKRRRVS